MSFAVFRDAITARFNDMAKKPLYCASVHKDIMRSCYIASFPPGTNPMFRKRTEHECSCCFGFIKTVGNAVAISDTGQIETIWDIECGDPTYDAVAKEMAALIRANPIKSIFLHYEEIVGTAQNYENGPDGVISWDHFHVKLPVRRNTGKNIVVAKDEIGTLRGKAHAAYDVFGGGLEKITVGALDIALELIDQNTLYRGKENESAIRAFRKLKLQFDAMPEEDRDNFTWSRSVSVDPAVTQIKNTAIGTFLVNLSENDSDLEASVGKYEAMVAPMNYRCPTALVTKVQVDRARATIEALGLTSALSRRYARLSDMNVTNALFVDRSVSAAMKGGDVFDSIATKGNVPKLDRVEEISIEKFLAEVLPKATTVEVMFENRLERNLVSLVAPADPAAKNLFKWSNPFSWSYTGDATDSIKERVKQAGGNVTGELCCRLAWYNYDDLDFHMKEPGGEIIWFRNKTSKTGGALDVDMNAGSGSTRTPVENIFYPSIARMPNGTYMLEVHQFCHRETKDVGFEIEIDHLGQVISMSYERAVKNKETVRVAELTKAKDGLTIRSLLPSSAKTASKIVWGLKTMEFQRVNSIALSPNYWSNQDGEEQGTGAKHYFFLMDGCVNDGAARGFYNEFLHADLNPHRKVLEMVGTKMKTDESKDQLSGVGFIATARNNVILRVSGAMTRTLKVNF